jgi:hypothetical protein
MIIKMTQNFSRLVMRLDLLFAGNKQQWLFLKLVCFIDLTFQGYIFYIFSHLWGEFNQTYYKHILYCEKDLPKKICGQNITTLRKTFSQRCDLQ